MFCKKRVLRNFAKFTVHRQTPVPESPFLIKVRPKAEHLWLTSCFSYPTNGLLCKVCGTCSIFVSCKLADKVSHQFSLKQFENWATLKTLQMVLGKSLFYSNVFAKFAFFVSHKLYIDSWYGLIAQYSCSSMAHTKPYL